MPNEVLAFTTKRGKNHGSSLYSAMGVRACCYSRNTKHRDAQVFAIKPRIVNAELETALNLPALTLVLIAGGNSRNPVSTGLDDTALTPQGAPISWNFHNCILWKTTAIEGLIAAATLISVSSTGGFCHREGGRCIPRFNLASRLIEHFEAAAREEVHLMLNRARKVTVC